MHGVKTRALASSLCMADGFIFDGYVAGLVGGRFSSTQEHVIPLRRGVLVL